MKTILEARKSIAQLWGYPKPKDTAYRLMKYTLQCEVEDGVLLHNCVTGQLFFLDSHEAELLKSLPSKPTDQMQELVSNHFLVPESFDEYRSVKQLRSIYQIRNTGDAVNNYIILPTTFCNAHCFYCYESDYPHIHMTEKTGQKLIEYIDKHRQGKPVSLNWFGGEPLVGMARIDQISQGLKNLGIPFSSSMISNGYLFNESVVNKSVDLWNLGRIQITLDGTEGVYNRVKSYYNVKDNPYHRVLNNIDLLSKRKINVTIRLNVDRYNKDDIRILIEELGKRYSGNKYVGIYLNMLFTDQGFEPVRHSQEDRIELLQIIDDYTTRLEELGLARNKETIPHLLFSQCMADDPHSIEIQPDGSFCRCEHETVFDCYGNLDEGISNPQRLIKWKETIERSEYCPECSLYPTCYLLRLCMNSDIPCIESVRERSKNRYKKRLCSLYYKNLEGLKDEKI